MLTIQYIETIPLTVFHHFFNFFLKATKIPRFLIVIFIGLIESYFNNMPLYKPVESFKTTHVFYSFLIIINFHAC